MPNLINGDGRETNWFDHHHGSEEDEPAMPSSQVSMMSVDMAQTHRPTESWVKTEKPLTHPSLTHQR